MQPILDAIAERREAFAAHPFLARLNRGEPYSLVRPIVPALAFWIMSFHDMLAILEADMVAPAFRRLARHHRAEEGGHDRWYFEDLERLEIPIPDARALFGPAHAATRRASWRLHGLAAFAVDDLERLVLILGLEATGSVFFEAASRYPHWPRHDLQFFSGHHLEVEQGHALFEARLRSWVANLPVSPARERELHHTVDQIFAAFNGMFDGSEAGVSPRPAGDLCGREMLAT